MYLSSLTCREMKENSPLTTFAGTQMFAAPEMRGMHRYKHATAFTRPQLTLLTSDPAEDQKP